jgi:hypothetical protein
MAINDTNIANDNFWLNMAAESAYSSSEKRTKSVESLKAIIIWAFALFSAGGFAFTLFGSLKEFDTYALLCFGAAFFLLTIAYVQAGRAQYPVAQSYNPLAPAEIKTAISEVVKTQANRFKWASGITSVAFFFLATGFLVEFGTVKNKKTETARPEKSFFVKTGLEKRNDSVYVPVTVMAKKNATVMLTFIKSAAGAVEDPKNTQVSGIFYADSTGNFYHTYATAKDSAKNIFVKVTVIQSVNADTTHEQSDIIKLAIPK